VGCYCDFLDIFFTLGDVLSPLLFNYYSCFVDYFYLLSRLRCCCLMHMQLRRLFDAAVIIIIYYL
jgi:hypothetical protein